jgi:hypothetical protein
MEVLDVLPTFFSSTCVSTYKIGWDPLLFLIDEQLEFDLLTKINTVHLPSILIRKVRARIRLIFY